MLFTFVVFYVFLNWREKIEWKSVENRVKRRIGKHVFSLFIDISYFCIVDRLLTGDSVNDPNAWKKQRREQYEALTTEPIKLNRRFIKSLLSNKESKSGYVSLFEKYESYLADTESRYNKFFNAGIQSALMDIQDHLHELRFILLRWIPLEEYSEDSIEGQIARGQKDFDDAIENSVRNIMKLIKKLELEKIEVVF